MVGLLPNVAHALMKILPMLANSNLDISRWEAKFNSKSLNKIQICMLRQTKSPASKVVISNLRGQSQQIISTKVLLLLTASVKQPLMPYLRNGATRIQAAYYSMLMSHISHSCHPKVHSNLHTRSLCTKSTTWLGKRTRIICLRKWLVLETLWDDLSPWSDKKPLPSLTNNCHF